MKKTLIILSLLLAIFSFAANAQDQDLKKFFKAAEEGDTETITSFIERGIDVNTATDDNGLTALMLASLMGRADAVKILLQAGADPDIQATGGYVGSYLDIEEYGDNDIAGYTALIFASLIADRDIVEMLVIADANPNIQADDGTNALMLVWGNGNEDIVVLLLDAGAEDEDFDDYDYYYDEDYYDYDEDYYDYDEDEDNATYIALMRAVRRGNKDEVELLLKAGADPYFYFYDQNETPLTLASEYGHKAVVEILLKVKTELEIRNFEVNYSLELASQNGHKEVVELLLKVGADPDIQFSDEDKTPLMMASENGHTEVVEILLNAGADPNIKISEDAIHALALAYKNEHNEILELLLNAGADPNSEAFVYMSPTILMDAAWHGEKEVVIMFLNAGADPNIQNDDKYETALMNAAEKGHKDIVELLLKAGAKPDIQVFRSGESALINAVVKGHKDIVELLLKAGANPNIQPDDDYTALKLAAVRGGKDMVETLLLYGADPNLKIGDRLTPLMIASQHGHKEVVEILLKANADPNIKAFCKNNSTALIRAVQGGHTEVVEMLLNSFANPNTQSYGDHNTALISASEQGNKKIIKLLKKYQKKFKGLNAIQENEDEDEYHDYIYNKTLEYIRNLDFSM